MRALEVKESSQVAEARRVAATAAQAHGFNPEDAGRVSLVATELATNLVKHAGGGMLLVGAFDDDSGAGIECIALDRGPGMIDVAASMRDGHSTAGSPGTGLGAAWRGSHSFHVYSRAERGSAILCRLQPGSPRATQRDEQPKFAAVSIAMPGEDACGDAWCRHEIEHGQALMVVDGLGHGSSAAQASLCAIRSFLGQTEQRPSEALQRLHADMRGTRGGAVAIARLDETEGTITFSGIGNVAATAVALDGSLQRMISNNGTVGHNARLFRDFSYVLPPSGVVILATDGISTNWSLDDYPGLVTCHPALIAAVLYRDFNRGRDDATVLVVRGTVQ